MSDVPHGSVKSYVVGFILSIVLTLAAYYLVLYKLMTGSYLVAALVTLGVGQAFIQLFFFLHLNEEKKPRWNIMVFYFMVMVLFILVLGTLWIMNNLNTNVMPMMDMQHQ